MNLIPRKMFLEDFFDDFELPSYNNQMKCDIFEKDDKYFIEIDIPGFDKKDIDINTDKGYLTITASKEDETVDEDKNYIRRERNYGKYQRQFYLGNVNENEIKADFKNGILTIVAPKNKEIETKKKIEIE